MPSEDARDDEPGGRPTVEVITATPDPERLICLGARNDYYSGAVMDDTFHEVMDGIEPDQADTEWAHDHLAEQGAEFQMNIEPVAKQRRLIRKLLERGHYGPFEHPSITVAVTGLSRSGMAQLTRHRHASFDVQSMRYVAFDDKDPEESVVHIPELTDPGLSGRNASFNDVHEDMDDATILKKRQIVYWRAMDDAFRRYRSLLDMGVAPENARMVLPIGTQVNLVMSLNLRMLLHIADMRATADAQWEIRGLTNQLLSHAADWAPITMGYYSEHMKGRKNRLAP